MQQDPSCSQCGSKNIYHDGSLWICPDCFMETTALTSQNTEGSGQDSKEALSKTIVDAYGTPLTDGDTVTVIKDLKVKGASGSIKVGTKVKNIRLLGGVDSEADGHNIACKIEGFGAMNLKSEFVKKA